MMTLSKQAFTAQNMIRGAGIVAATLLIAACSGSPTPNYYTLANKVTPLPSSKVKVIEVLPVGLPD